MRYAMKTKTTIAQALAHSPMAEHLGHGSTGCYYIEQKLLREDGTWSPAYVLAGTEGDAEPTKTADLEQLLRECKA